MKQAFITKYLDNSGKKKQNDLPSDFDLKFAEQTIEAYVANYEQTGEFLSRRAVEKITRQIKNMAIGLAMGAVIGAALFAPMVMGL